MHELLTEEVVTMEERLHELKSQCEISESASRQFQDQVMQLQKALNDEESTGARRQSQLASELKAQLEAADQKIAQETQLQEMVRLQSEVQRLQKELDAAAISVEEEQRGSSQAAQRVTQLEGEVTRLQQERQKQQETLTLVRARFLPCALRARARARMYYEPVLSVVLCDDDDDDDT